MGLETKLTLTEEYGSDEVERYERLKLLFLSLAFFLVIGAYTIAKELKDAVFISIVGREYIPLAKIPAMLVLVPAILFYSSLVDRMRRYQLFSALSAVFGLLGLVFTYFIGHSSYGIANTDTSPYRMFGWIFYCFVEGYAPFVVSVFWAFANSINSPETAKKNYGLMVSGSKIGGMFSSGLAWLLFSLSASPKYAFFSDAVNHQIVFGVSSVLLLCIPIVIKLLMTYVPGRFLHGYEAVYQAEKLREKTKTEKTGLFSGLVLLLKYPYVLGIFGMVYFYEVVATVLSYLRLGVAQSNAMTVSEVSAFLFKMIFLTHAVGLPISLFGTGALLKWLGERVCLLLVPLVSGLLLLYLMVETTPTALMVAFIALKAINYAFAWPVRESLYIPTVKEIKFKSRSWVDAFGSKFAKSSGSMFNFIATKVGSTLLVPAHSFFFAGIVGLWFVTAFLLGKRFDKAVASDEVIGLDDQDNDDSEV